MNRCISVMVVSIVLLALGLSIATAQSSDRRCEAMQGALAVGDLQLRVVFLERAASNAPEGDYQSFRDLSRQSDAALRAFDALGKLDLMGCAEQPDEKFGQLPVQAREWISSATRLGELESEILDAFDTASNLNGRVPILAAHASRVAQDLAEGEAPPEAMYRAAQLGAVAPEITSRVYELLEGGSNSQTASKRLERYKAVLERDVNLLRNDIAESDLEESSKEEVLSTLDSLEGEIERTGELMEGLLSLAPSLFEAKEIAATFANDGFDLVRLLEQVKRHLVLIQPSERT